MHIAFDFETHLIAPGKPFPSAVCMSFAGLDLASGAVHGESVVTAAQGIRWLYEWLQAGHTLVGANTAFDALVSCNSAHLAGLTFDEMLEQWVRAYDSDRVTDVLLTQALIDFSEGYQHHRYALDEVCSLINTTLRPDKTNEWRVRFAELDGVPIDQYPERARTYALEDSICTAQAYTLQCARARAGSPYFPGRNALDDQYRQARGAFALKDLEGIGLRTDPRSVARLRASTERRMAELRDGLVAAGYVYPHWEKDQAAIKAKGWLDLSATGRLPTAKGVLRAHAQPEVRALADWPRSAEWLRSRGLATFEFRRDAKRAQSAMLELCRATGRDPVLTDTAKKERSGKLPTRSGPVAANECKLDADACERAYDAAQDTRWAATGALLKDYAEYSSLNKLLTTDFQLLESAAQAPLHAYYRPLQSTGRTSTGEGEGGGKGNVQNMPRKPGVRECYVPSREGWVFFDADYAAVELCTFAQICKWVVGWSKLADDINAGIDPHMRIGAAILHISYEEAVTRKKEALLKDKRTAGKAINFGRKGKMSAARFVEYAWNNYRVNLGATPDEQLRTAQLLVDLHDTLTPEFPVYSQWVTDKARSGARDAKHDLVHPYSGRLRAGLGYTDAHNYPFQGLAADLAKLALWEVCKARHGLGALGKQDPLHVAGAEIVLFTHDSITGQCPLAHGHACATRLGEIMQECSRLVLPDCPSAAEPALMTRLSKLAGPVYSDSEKTLLMPWDPWQACESAAKDWLKKDPNNQLEALPSELSKQQWPEYVIEDTWKKLRSATPN